MHFQGCSAGASVFSLGKASLEQLTNKHVPNLSKGTDNSEALLMLEKKTVLGTL